MNGAAVPTVVFLSERINVFEAILDDALAAGMFESMMKIRIYVAVCFGISLIFLLFMPLSARAQIKCRKQTPSLSFSTATAPTKYIRGISAKNLTQMHGAGTGSTVGGLGGGEIGFKTESRFEVANQDGQACVRLKRVSVIFYAKPAIHIASNFNRSSCEYNAVMAHEKKHIATLLKFVREYKPKAHYEVTRMLETMQTASGPVSLPQAEAEQQKIQSELGKKIQAYSTRIMSVLEQRQQAIDTPQEYARVSAQCGRWEQKLGRE